MGTNIMIIDDSYTNRMLLKAALTGMDINITEATTGFKALKLLEGISPDLILLDICMPMMNGFDFLEQLKSLKKNIPVVVVTILDDRSYMLQALQSGACDYLLKPLDINILLCTIAKYTEYELKTN